MHPRSPDDPGTDPESNTKMDAAPDGNHTTSEPPLRSPDPAKEAGHQDAESVGVDQGLIPHVASSAAHLVDGVAKGVMSAIDEAVIWAEKKAEALSEEVEGGVGPYASPATCMPSDLDPLASGVLPAIEAEKAKANQVDGTAKDAENAEK